MRYLGLLLAIAIAVYALTDLAGSDERRRGGVPKAVWTIIILLPLLGPAVWLLVSRIGATPGSSGRAAPIAPDDDPDFLWKLDQEKRRAQRETRDPGDTDPT